MKQFNIPGFIVALLLCLSAMRAGAQQQPAGDDPALKDKIRAAQIAYLSKQLDLTPEEAQKFWPIYNNYSHEVEQLIAERRQNRKDEKQTNKDDVKAQQALDKEMDLEQRMLNVRQRYKQEFLKALPPRKAGSVFKAEREFRMQLLRQLNERRTDRNMRRFKQ